MTWLHRDEWRKGAATLLLGLVMVLAGCATDRMKREGEQLVAAGQFEAGIAKLEQWVLLHPDDVQARIQLANKRAKAIALLTASARNNALATRYDEASQDYARVLKIDPNNSLAKAGLDDVARQNQAAEALKQASALLQTGDREKALAILQPLAAENPDNQQIRDLLRQAQDAVKKTRLTLPNLSDLYAKPINLEFRDANLKMIFEVMSRDTGINFILDKDVRSDVRTTLFLKQSPLADAVDLLLATNQLDKKILNANSVLVFPNTPDKIKSYQELMIKGFYLANADGKQMLNTLKTLLKAKDVILDEKLNLILMRDKPEAIRLAEKVIAMQDMGEPEVMLEVEVLEVQRNRLEDLGIIFPQQLTLTPLPSNGDDGTVTLSDLKNINSDRIGAALGSTTLNLLKQVGTVDILANPRIRAKNHEKAKILIGDKVPVITSTSTSTGFLSESVQYLDVGLKLEFEPSIYLDNEISINMALEVSSIAQTIKTSSGTVTYQIGTRTASTTLRLKDGETQILAGLINDQDSKTINKVPGLGDLPIAGRLFSDHRDNKLKTEIVLSVTPRLIRGLRRPEAGSEEFWSGTEDNLKTDPLVVRAARISSLLDPDVRKSQEQSEDVNLPKAAGQDEAQGAPEISFKWNGPTTVKVGEQFKMELLLTANRELRGIPFQVAFDREAFQAVDVADGGFLKSDGAQANFITNVDPSTGRIFVGMNRTGAGGLSGSGRVAIITLRAISPKSQGRIELLVASTVSKESILPPTNMPLPHMIEVTP